MGVEGRERAERGRDGGGRRELEVRDPVLGWGREGGREGGSGWGVKACQLSS